MVLARAAGLDWVVELRHSKQRVAEIGLKVHQCLRQVRAKCGGWNRTRVQRKAQ